MKRWIFLALLALPLHAQTAVTVWLSSQQNGGGDSFPASRPNATTDFANGSGYGLSVDRMFGTRFSGELAIFRTSSDGTLRDNGVAFVSLGDVELTPITAMLQAHFRPIGPLDVYVGGGGAYVMTGDLDSADLREDGLAPLQLEEETTFVIGGGATWSFTDRIGATLEARYLPLTLHAKAGGASADADIDPLIISAGLRIRFSTRKAHTMTTIEHADRFLVARLLRGDEEAFAEFFDRNFALLYRFALPRVADEDAAEEVVQTTLCRAVRKLSSYRGEAALLTWLTTICRHEISTYFEKRSKVPPMLDLSDDLPEIRAALESLGAESTLQRREIARLVQVVLDRLPNRYGDALEWKYIDGLTVAEMAERLALTPKAAESLLTRARAAFRDAFTAAYGSGWNGAEVSS